MSSRPGVAEYVDRWELLAVSLWSFDGPVRKSKTNYLQ